MPLSRTPVAKDEFGRLAILLFGGPHGILQQPLFELLAQEVDILAVGLVVGDAGAVSEFVHVAR